MTDRDGTIIEALGIGVTQRTLADYTPTEFYVVHINASEEDRQEAVRFAHYCLQTRQRYSWLEIVSIALSLLTGAKLRFGIDGGEICSGLVAKALERTSAIFEKESSHMMPADLAKYYHVEPPRFSPTKAGHRRSRRVAAHASQRGRKMHQRSAAWSCWALHLAWGSGSSTSDSQCGYFWSADPMPALQSAFAVLRYFSEHCNQSTL